MSVISTKTIPGSMASRMSANPAQLDELNFDRVKNYVNINKEHEEVKFLFN